MPNADARGTVVLGLGNMLMADDGLGLAALARLEDDWVAPHNVSLVDGGTWGMNLLHIIEGARNLLIFDAIDAGLAPGSIVRLRGAEVPRRLATKLSPHQIDLREVLAVAELRGYLPANLVALGIQPARIEMSTTLSPQVEARLDALVRMGVATLAGWGCRFDRSARRAVPDREAEPCMS